MKKILIGAVVLLAAGWTWFAMGVVPARTGATVAGVIGPADFLEPLRWGEPRFGPAIVFQRERQGQSEAFPGPGPSDGIRLEEDGSFRAAGLPPGEWDALLVYQVPVGDTGRATRSLFLQTLADLADGEERELHADLGHLVPGTLSGTVMLDGQPLAGTQLQLIGRHADGYGGEVRFWSNPVKTAADGTFSLQAEPASYRVQVRLPQEGTDGVVLISTEEIALGPREKLSHVFHVRGCGPLRLRVLRSDGRPVAGIEVLANMADHTWGGATPKTDEDGWTTLTAPPGAVELTALPQRLLDPQARQEFLEANAGDPDAWENVMLQLGRAEIAAGEGANEVVVRLPESSGY